jgi:hypothetical protein
LFDPGSLLAVAVSIVVISLLSAMLLSADDTGGSAFE